MAINSTLIKSKSSELINLLTNLEGESLDKDERSKIAEMIERVLVHTSITLDYIKQRD